MPRQSASNNPVLARIKALLNAPHYKMAMTVTNESNITAAVAAVCKSAFAAEYRAKYAHYFLTGEALPEISEVVEIVTVPEPIAETSVSEPLPAAPVFGKAFITVSDNFGHSVTVPVKWDGTEEDKPAARRAAFREAKYEAIQTGTRKKNDFEGGFVSTEEWVPATTETEVRGLKVGDKLQDVRWGTKGRAETVVLIKYVGQDINGKWFVMFETTFGAAATITGSMKEGEAEYRFM